MIVNDKPMVLVTAITRDIDDIIGFTYTHRERTCNAAPGFCETGYLKAGIMMNHTDVSVFPTVIITVGQ